jgi:hypothetical protein
MREPEEHVRVWGSCAAASTCETVGQRTQQQYQQAATRPKRQESMFKCVVAVSLLKLAADLLCPCLNLRYSGKRDIAAVSASSVATTSMLKCLGAVKCRFAVNLARTLADLLLLRCCFILQYSNSGNTCIFENSFNNKTCKHRTKVRGTDVS